MWSMWLLSQCHRVPWDHSQRSVVPLLCSLFSATCTPKIPHGSFKRMWNGVSLVNLKYNLCSFLQLLCYVKYPSMNKANLRDLIAATGLVISNWIQIINFSPVWQWNLMDDLENNRAVLLYYIKLCASFQIHCVEFKPDLQSRNAHFGSKLVIFYPVWPWNLMDDFGKQ